MEHLWFCLGSNQGPFACKANVITTTLQNHKPFLKVIRVGQMRSYFFLLKIRNFNLLLYLGTEHLWFCLGSNQGPFPCKANVITTTLQNHKHFLKVIRLWQMRSFFLFTENTKFLSLTLFRYGAFVILPGL